MFRQLAGLCLVTVAITSQLPITPEAPQERTDFVQSYEHLLDELVESATPKVYKVRINGTDQRGQQVQHEGCAVSGGRDRFNSVAHLSQGLRNITCEIEVDGEWKRASFQPRAGTDFSELVCDGVDLEFIESRGPVYNEDVLVVGAVTGEHAGRITNLRETSLTVSFEPDDSGITQGDSGGGVFAKSDGRLLGVIRAKNTNDGHVCYFEPIPAESVEVSGSVAFEAKVQNGWIYFQDQGRWQRGRNTNGRLSYKGQVYVLHDNQLILDNGGFSSAPRKGNWVCDGNRCEWKP